MNSLVASSNEILTPRRRDVLLGLLAIGLLATPLWAPMDDLGGETYTYERAQVVVDDENGITYVGDPAVSQVGTISDELGCSTGFEIRTCAFERLLVENETVPAGAYTTTTDYADLPSLDGYRYVQIDGDVYSTEYVANESATGQGGMYRVELALEPGSASDALDRISVATTAEYRDVPDVVAEAAREGSATSHREHEVPQTPIRLDDGRYYRVYQSERSSSDVDPRLPDVVFDVAGVTIGLLVLHSLSRRFEVSYVGDER